MLRVQTSVAALACLLVVTALDPAAAAGGAFAVDDSEIGKPGECKVESWVSHAGNGDLAIVSSPACVARIVVPVELGLALARSRAGHEWGTDLGLKAKWTALSVEGPGKVGLGLSVATSFDLVAHENTGTAINVPLTFQLSEQVRANFNAGWSFDNTTDTHYGTWGAGLEWNIVKPVTLIAEVFGISGRRPEDEPRSVTEPRAQVGLRYTPRENIDFDVIYGRNITGEDSNWVTGGVNIRF